MSKKSVKKATLTYAEALAELEEILAWFEKDSPDLDASLKKFERGMVLTSTLKQQLEQAEVSVQKIKQSFE